jgi:hypothetical protein
VHRQELAEAAKQSARQNLSASIQANAARPNEGGARKGSAAPARDPNSIRNMTPEKRQEIIERVRRGERITSDMLY